MKPSFLRTPAQAPVRDATAKGGRVMVAPSRPALSILRPYQVDGINYLRRQNGCGALLWEMRLGKTLTVIRFLSQRKDARRVLVVAPYSALDGWREELFREKEEVPKDVYYYKPSLRKDYFYNTRIYPGWFLINKEAFLYCDYLNYQWDAIIIDETWLANPLSKITKYFLRSVDAKYRILLSGTPAPESELQYFTQLHWVNPEILKCKSYWDYRIRYFRPEGYEWKMSLRGKQFLASRLAQHCSVLKRKDVNLEKKHIFERRVIQLAPKTRRLYEDAERGLLEGKVLKFAGQWWNAMRRLCSLKEKEVELLSLINGELKNEKVIIWADFTEEVERIARLLSCDYIHGGVPQAKRDEIKKAFLTGGRFLVAQPQCWKWGTNLSGVDTIIFFSLPQGLLTWQQVQERTVNLMSKQSLLIIALEAENTIEGDIYKSLQEKENNQQQLDRFRRAILERNK